MLGGPVQVPGRVHLRTQDGRQTLRGQRPDHTVVQHTGRVHHSRDRMPRHQLGHRNLVRYVTGLHGHRRALLLQFRDKFLGALGGRTAAADQQQTPHTVLGHQVPGHRTAQAARTTGDQYGPLGTPHRRTGLDRRRHPGQPGRQHLTTPDQQLRLVQSERPTQQGRRGVLVAIDVDVDQAEASGVLGLCRADQAPDGSADQVLTCRRASRHEHETRTGEPLFGQPRLHQTQHPRRGRMHRLHHGIGTAGRSHRHQHHTRNICFRFCERQQIRARLHRRPGEHLGVRLTARHLDRSPDEFEQRVVADSVQLIRRDRSDCQRLDRGDRGTHGVRHRDREVAFARPGQTHPHRGRSRRVQRYTAPGERNPGPAALAQTDQRDRVQARVEQRGVQAECLAVDAVRQSDLGEHVLADPPCRPQPLERGAVLEAGVGEPLVAAVHVDRLGALRRPDRGVERRRGRSGGRSSGRIRHEGAADVQRPQLVVGVVRAGVHGHRAASGPVRFAGPHLQLDAAPIGQDQRRGQGQFLHRIATDLRTGVQHELQQRRAGHEHRAHHHMVGEPGVRLHAQPAGEQEPVGARQFHGPAEQRVFRGLQSDGLRAAAHRHHGGPEPLVLEGIGRQVDTAGSGTGEERRPVDTRTAEMQSRHRVDDRGFLGPALAQDGHEHGGLVGHRFPRHGRQNAVGAELQEPCHTLGLQGTDAVREADRLTDMTHPVLRRAQLLGSGLLAGEVRDHGDGRRGVRQTLQNRAEVLQHRIHQRRVERVRNAKSCRLAALALEVRPDLLDRTLRARNHDGRRAVDGRDRHGIGQMRLDLVLGGLESHHRAAGRQRLHQTTTRRHKGTRIGQREDTRHMGGRDLTDGVSRHEVGTDTPGLHQPEQRHLDREQPGLGVHRPVQQIGIFTPDHLMQRTVQVLIKPRTHRIEGIREHREPAVQLTAHPQPLRTLTREQQRQKPLGVHSSGRLAPRHRAESGHELVLVAADDHGTVLERRPGRRQRERHVHRPESGVAVHPGEQPLGLGAQGVPVVGGEQPRHDRGRALRLLGRGRGDGRCLLDQHVCVGTADTERRHARAPRTAGGGPVPGPGQELYGAGRPVHLGGGFVDVERRRKHAMAHGHDHLDDTGDAGRCLRVTDVRLHRAQPQRPVPGPVLAVRRQQRLGLDRVAQGRTRAVRLDDVDLVGGEARVGESLSDHASLGGAVRGGEAVAGAVLVDGRAADDGEHGVTVAYRVRQPFDDEEAGALGESGSVGGRGEGLAPAVRGEGALAAELGEHAGCRQDRDAARHRQGAVALAQRLHREVQCHQGGRAGGVHRDRGPFEAQLVRHPAGDDAAVSVAAGVVVVHDAGEDARLRALQGRRVDAGPLQRLPGQFERQPLLGVHGEGLARRDPEEAGVEVRHGVEESARVGVVVTGVGGVRVAEGREVPAAVRREGGDRVRTGRHQLPQVLGARDPARVAAGHAHDGDRLVLGGGELPVVLPQPGGLQPRGAQRTAAGVGACVGLGAGLRVGVEFRVGVGEGIRVGRQDPDLRELQEAVHQPRVAQPVRRDRLQGLPDLVLARHLADAVGRHRRQLGFDVAGHSKGVGVVEDEGGRQAQAGDAVELVAQFGRGQGVETELLEGPCRFDRLRGGVSEYRCDLLTHDVQHRTVPLGRRQARQAPVEVGHRRVSAGDRRRPPDRRCQSAQQRGHFVGTGAQRGDVHANGHDGGTFRAQAGREQRQPGLVRERGNALRRHPLAVDVAQVLAEAGADLPQAEGHGRGREPLGVPVGRQGVEEDVRGGVVALSGGQHEATGGGEEDEGRQIHPTRQLVQVPGRVRLGRQHRLHLLARQSTDQGAVAHSGRVHDGRQRPLGGDVVEESGQCVAVRDVARDDPRPRAEAVEFRGQFGRSRGLKATAAGQHQVPYAPLHDQVTGHHRAQTTGTTRDQNRAVDVERHIGPVRHRTDQTRDQHLIGTYRQLRLARSDRSGQQRVTGLQVPVHVQQDEPARILRLRRTDQTPHRSLHHIQRRAPGRGHRVARHHDQARLGEPLLGQPAPDRVQRVVHRRPHIGRHIARRGRRRTAAVQHHRLRHRLGVGVPVRVRVRQCIP